MTSKLYGAAGRVSERDAARRQLISSTVRLAREVMHAQAASVFTVTSAGSLRMEAISGQGEERLLGWEIPADEGIAGWVHRTGESIIVHDVSSDARFNRAAAEATGYIPKSIAAASLSTASRDLGVLEILDPDLTVVSVATCMNVMSELARQTCSALVLDDRDDFDGVDKPFDADELADIIRALALGSEPGMNRALRGLAYVCYQLQRREG